MDADAVYDRPQRVVVKVGTRLVIDTEGRARPEFLERLAREIRAVMDLGVEVVLITSGAVGIGRRLLFPPGRVLRAGERPSAAAAGQPVLMRYWAEALAAQQKDAELAARFTPVAAALAAAEATIVTELGRAQGKAVDIDGYFRPDLLKTTQAMRPSATFNAIIDGL